MNFDDDYVAPQWSREVEKVMPVGAVADPRRRPAQSASLSRERNKISSLGRRGRSVRGQLQIGPADARGRGRRTSAR